MKDKILTKLEPCIICGFKKRIYLSGLTKERHSFDCSNKDLRKR